MAATDIMTTREVAEKLKVCYTTLMMWRKSGKIVPIAKTTAGYLWAREAVEQLAARRAEQAAGRG